MATVKKSMKKYQMGGKSISGSIPKGVKVDTSKTIKSMNKYMEKPKRDSVESEMFPGKKIPIGKSNYENSNFDKMFPKAKPAPVKKKAKSGASLKPVPADKEKSLGKLPTPVRNKMGFQKNGGKTKAKSGAALKKQAATAIAMKKAGKAPKKAMGGMKMMKGGGKCKYGC